MRRKKLLGLAFGCLLAAGFEVAEGLAAQDQRASSPAEEAAKAEAAVKPEAPSPGERAQFDPVVLGMTEAALREKFGAALTERKIASLEHPATGLTIPRLGAGAGVAAGGKDASEKDASEKDASEKDASAKRPAAGQPEAPAVDPYEGQLRLVRRLDGGDVRGVEYDLYKGKVYAIRWRLDDRFERPIMPDLVQTATARFGEPLYDQFIPAKFGSPKAELQRAGWSRKGRILEVRQLHPLTGGAVYLTLTDEKTGKDIVQDRRIVAPAPDSTGPWWEHPSPDLKLVTKEERSALLAAFDALLEQTGF